MVEMEEIGGHAVYGGDGAERADMVIAAAIAHHANGFDGEEDGEGLPDLVIKPRITNFFKVYGICLSEDFEFFKTHRPGDADGKAWPGERVGFRVVVLTD